LPRKGTGEDRSRQGNGGEKNPDLTRLSQVAVDQAFAASDQNGADKDQTGSDADQTLSDAELALADRDQLASDRDQIASDRDQAASDQELLEHPGPQTKAAHEAHQADRAVGTQEREEVGKARAQAAEELARLATRRDTTAWQRDVTAQARDGAAERRDRDSAKIERKMASRGLPLRTAITHAAELREQAARDRARAAEDRAQAAADRERAAEEREAALAELRRAHLDELTGAFRRGSGEDALQAEIDRARRGDGTLVLAFIDVDNLRRVNNRDGHAAGDALLRNVVAAIRSQIRSYEPIVRFGGDEFVCAVTGLDLAQAEERFAGIQKSLAEDRARASLSFGLAELRDDDNLGELIERADLALLEARRRREAD
jgi:diguanylate cyclase (GGDEF)-like protein